MRIPIVMSLGKRYLLYKSAVINLNYCLFFFAERSTIKNPDNFAFRYIRTNVGRYYVSKRAHVREKQGVW